MKTSQCGSVVYWLTYASVLTVFIAVGVKYFVLTDLHRTLDAYDFLNSFDDATEYNMNRHRYLAGNFRPVDEENLNVEMEVISGEIPSDLSGLFLRVGSNPLPGHRSRRYHWFDGHGMIHSVRVINRKATYSNQWIRTPRFDLEKGLNRPVFMQLGEIRGVIGLIKILLFAPIISSLTNLGELVLGTANTAITVYRDRILAGHEGSLPFEIQWQPNNSFSSIGYINCDNSLDYQVSAHTRVEPEDGNLYFNGYNVAGEGSIKTGSVRDSSLLSYFPINLPVNSWVHDMMITENYMLQFESSIHFDKNGIMEGVFFNFVPEHRLRIGVTPKTANVSSDVLWFEADAPYAIVHAMNAWEEVNAGGEDEIVLWVPLGSSFDGNLENIDNKFFLSEVRMNLKTGQMTVNMVDTSRTSEFPRVHPSYLGRRSKFGFAGQFNPNIGMFSQLLKYDLESKSLAGSIDLGADIFCGEGVLIPKPVEFGRSSDGVYITTFVQNEVTKQSEWHVYDGSSMNPEPVVRMRVGKRVPYGFHGEWVTEDVLQRHLSRVVTN